MTWEIAARHEAFGVEGRRLYQGTELGARRAAAKIAREGGHGWAPVVAEVEPAEAQS